MRDVDDWSGEGIRTIAITLGISPVPLVLQVKRFKPAAGDITYRCWRDGNVVKRTELEPYALANIRQASQALKEYINANVMNALVAVTEDENNDELIRETFRWVILQYQNLRVSSYALIVRRNSVDGCFRIC